MCKRWWADDFFSFSVETYIKNEVSDDSSSQLDSTTEPPDLQAVETNCNETILWPESLDVSPSSVPDAERTADSTSSDESTVTLNSSKSHDDLNKDHHNSDKTR